MNYYQMQFLQNEHVEAKWLGNAIVSSKFAEADRYCPGTMTGTIFVSDLACYTFSVDDKDKFKFTSIGVVNFHILSAEINQGELVIEVTESYNSLPVHLVINYEYDDNEHGIYNVSFDSPPTTPTKMLKRADGTSFPAPTFEKFFNHEQIEYLRKTAETKAVWDFNTALGCTIKEKYESLYVKCVEITNVMQAKGASGCFWIVCSPEIASIFEVATAGFNPTSWFEPEDYSAGVPALNLFVENSVRFAGTVNYRWRLYKDSKLSGESAGHVLFGVNDYKEDPKHYAALNILNFIN